MGKAEFRVYSSSQEAWDAMYQAVCDATKSIYLEVYIMTDEGVGKKFLDTLEQKARDGVNTKVIVDAMGSGFHFSNNRINSMRDAGVDLRFFNEAKHRFLAFWRLFLSRTHRKILVIDEHVGFIGGVNIDHRVKDWLDMHVRIVGKPVRSMLRSFAKSYIICGGKKSDVRHLLKYPFRVKSTLVEFVYDDAGKPYSKVRRVYSEAFFKARERVILFSPYYFPDKNFLYGLWMARKRGVRVDLLIPFRSDLRIANYAAYAWFSFMTFLGVHIHLTKKMMHGKGVVVDDTWAMVGSSNIEHTSFYDNYEANVKIRDKETVRTIRDTLDQWVKEATPLDKTWEKRSLVQRVKEWVSLKLYIIWHKKGRDLKLDRIIADMKRHYALRKKQ